jgi:mono/diheme cytochrome c family protein
MTRLTLSCAVLVGAIAAGCADMAATETAPMSAVSPAPAPAAPISMADAEALYVEKCGMCHRGNGMGSGLLARRLPPDMAALEARAGLTEEFVTTVVRTGVLNMPPLSRAEVSDPQLAAIAEYLAAGPYDAEGDG